MNCWPVKGSFLFLFRQHLGIVEIPLEVQNEWMRSKESEFKMANFLPTRHTVNGDVRGDFTRSPKQGYQKGLLFSNFFFFKKSVNGDASTNADSGFEPSILRVCVCVTTDSIQNLTQTLTVMLSMNRSLLSKLLSPSRDKSLVF